MPAGSRQPPPSGHVAIVTDSAACLPGELIKACRVIVVPLRLVAGGMTALDGDPATAGGVEQAVARGERLTTARPAPEHFDAAYRRAAAEGAGAVVSVHPSARLSGTASSAELAAAASPVPVTIVDGRSIGMGLGLTVLAAAAAAGRGRTADEVAAVARWHADRSMSFFAVDSATALLAGGRLSEAGQPAWPAALVARPILTVGAGRVFMLERVRTRAAAAGRLADLAAGAARKAAAEGSGDADGVDVAVQHTAAAARAADLRDRIAVAVPQARNVYLVEAGMAIMAHTGTGMLGVAIGPHLPG